MEVADGGETKRVFGHGVFFWLLLLLPADNGPDTGGAAYALPKPLYIQRERET